MRRIVKRFLKIVALGTALTLIGVGVWAGWMVTTIPDAELIATYRPEEATEVMDRNGIVLKENLQPRISPAGR